MKTTNVKLYTVALILTLSGFSGKVKAQTHLIAHKSHSGNLASFRDYILEEGTAGGFGVGPERTIREAHLDSVIFVSDDKAIMVTSEVCTDRRWESRETKSIWKAGKDTVYNHPVFSKQHSLDSIKKVLKQFYYFRNPVDSVRFIGYDNGEWEAEPTEASIIAFPGKQDGSSGAGTAAVFVFGTIFLISIITGFISWLFRRPHFVSR